MKKFVVILMLTGIALGQAKPKWHDPDAWRKRLRRGLPDKRLLTVLGRPAYVRIASGRAYWYYGAAPKCVPAKDSKTGHDERGKKLKDRDTGIVICRDASQFGKAAFMSRPVRPRYLVHRWTEPDWKSTDLTKNNTKQQPKKRKRLRKPKSWENPLAWKRLMRGMSVRAAERFTGAPEREMLSEGTRQWYYGDVQNCGVLSFQVNRLRTWNEPFWPEVNKMLYAPAESKRAE